MADAAQAHRHRRRKVLNYFRYNLIKAENGFLVEKTPGPEKGYESQRLVFVNAAEVGEFFHDEARAMEEPVEKKEDQPPGDRFYGRPAPTSPVLDYPSPKVGSGKPGMQPPLGGAKVFKTNTPRIRICNECKAQSEPGGPLHHWMSCSEYTGHF
jgi:hypothetical protein